MTSSHGDRKASFQVDGKDYSFNIPFYSGFIGQWGWKGESEGYMKDASIAYVGTHRHSSRAVVMSPIFILICIKSALI